MRSLAKLFMAFCLINYFTQQFCTVYINTQNYDNFPMAILTSSRFWPQVNFINNPSYPLQVTVTFNGTRKLYQAFPKTRQGMLALIINAADLRNEALKLKHMTFIFLFFLYHYISSYVQIIFFSVTSVQIINLKLKT